MRFRRFRRFRKSGPRFLWFRRRSFQNATSLDTTQVPLFNVATDLLQTPSGALEGQEILLKALRLEIFCNFALGTGATLVSGTPFQFRFGVFVAQDTTAAGAFQPQDPRWGVLTFSAREDWLAVWNSAQRYQVPPLGTSIEISEGDTEIINRHVKVSRKMRTNDNLVFVACIDPNFTLGVLPLGVGTGGGLTCRVEFSALLRTTRPGL